MTPTFRSILAAGFIGLAATATPAAAGGSISLNFAPSTAEQSRLLAAGLGIYSAVNAARGNATINQRGTGLIAGIAQAGRANSAVVHQRGHGHAGTIEQTGHGNRYGLFQFGRNTTGHVVQHGNGATGATVQFGW